MMCKVYVDLFARTRARMTILASHRLLLQRTDRHARAATPLSGSCIKAPARWRCRAPAQRAVRDAKRELTLAMMSAAARDTCALPALMTAVLVLMLST